MGWAAADDEARGDGAGREMRVWHHEDGFGEKMRKAHDFWILHGMEREREGV